MYFKVIIESGHIGPGKANETVYYVEADSTVDLFAMMKSQLALKSKGSAITMVKPVDAQEYETEKIVAWKREYISHLRI